MLSDAPFFDHMAVQGHRPRLALLVEIDQIFHHCSKAFLRSGMWKPDTWHPETVASRPEIAKTLERPEEDLAELERYYGPEYARHLYGS